LRVALEAAGDKVAVGIAAALDERHDVVETLDSRSEPPQTVKAKAAFACVDGLAEFPVAEKVGLLEICGGKRPGRTFAHAGRASQRRNLFREAHFDDVTGLAALEKTQGAIGDKAAHGLARRRARETRATSKPSNGKTETACAFEAAVAKQMRIDGAVNDGEAKTRNEKIFELLPNLEGIGFLVIHGLSHLRTRHKAEERDAGADEARDASWRA